ncbi:MAG: BNR-4 repeat-containing protein [Planctomycetes bacterium]|nr:BNR-4 repeat-containing protein [Planctomycetota bacterium]
MPPQRSWFRVLLVGFSPMAAVFAQDEVHGHLLNLHDNGAWSWFEDERAIVDPLRGRLLVASCADSSGVGGTARGGDIDVAWLDLSAGRFGAFELHDRLQGDDHNSPALLVRPDGRYLAVYGTHGGSHLTRWRVTTNPGDPSAWTTEASYSHPVDMSYSNVFHLSSTGRTYNFVRAINWDPNVMWSTDQGTTWSGGGKLLTEGGSGDRPYVKYASDGIARVHVLTTERHPRNYDNSIYHGYVENDQLRRSDGTLVDANVLDAAGQAPSSLTPVLQAGAVFGGAAMRRGWTVDLRVDPDGTVRALFQARANGNNTDHRLLFGRYDGSAWSVHEVCRMGAYLYAAEDDYTGLAALQPDRPDTIFVSTRVDPRNGAALAHYEIFTGSTATFGASWTWTPVTENSSVDNVRPIVPAWDGQRLALLWLRGTYSTYTDFHLAVVGLVQAPELDMAPATFVDATTANTTLATGLPANPTGPTSGQGADDGAWHLRSGYGNGGEVWTASETGGENAPTLRTRVGGLAPGLYDVFVVAWSNPNEDWTLRAGFAPGALRTYEKRGMAMVDNNHFSAPLVTSTASVRAYSTWIGRAAPNGNGDLDVYVDDLDAGQNGASRSWYDGVALAPVAASASTQVVGEGCNGSALLDVAGAPQLGGAMQYRVTGGTPATWAFAVVGAGELQPVPLAPFGFAGCTLYVPPWGTVSLGVVDAAGDSPAATLTLPNDPALRRLRFGLQGGALGSGLEFTPAVVLLPGS